MDFYIFLTKTIRLGIKFVTQSIMKDRNVSTGQYFLA